jgi:hypothetical protein
MSKQPVFIATLPDFAESFWGYPSDNFIGSNTGRGLSWVKWKGIDATLDYRFLA